MMTVRTGFRFISALAVAVSLTLPAMPARAEDPPPGDVEEAISRAQRLILQGDSRGGCKEYLRASELSQGKSMRSWVGLSDCEKELGSFDKAVDMARKAHSVASTLYERIQSSVTLACALLVKPDAQANAEAAALLKDPLKEKEKVTNPWQSRLQAAYFQALLELNRDSEAAEFLHSSAWKDKVDALPCRVVDQQQADALNERLHAIDPDLDVFPIGAEVTRPEIAHKVDPQISNEARQHPGFSGQVIMEALIDRQGRVQDVRVVKGQPYGLSEIAASTLKQWRFKPATFKGRPVKAFYILTITFRVT
jgi:TonB family protein